MPRTGTYGGISHYSGSGGRGFRFTLASIKPALASVHKQYQSARRAFDAKASRLGPRHKPEPRGITFAREHVDGGWKLWARSDPELASYKVDGRYGPITLFRDGTISGDERDIDAVHAPPPERKHRADDSDLFTWHGVFPSDRAATISKNFSKAMRMVHRYRRICRENPRLVIDQSYRDKSALVGPNGKSVDWVLKCFVKTR